MSVRIMLTQMRFEKIEAERVQKEKEGYKLFLGEDNYFYHDGKSGLLCTDQAAKYVNLSMPIFMEWYRKGRIKHHKIAYGKRYFSKTDLDKYLWKKDV